MVNNDGVLIGDIDVYIGELIVVMTGRSDIIRGKAIRANKNFFIAG